MIEDKRALLEKASSIDDPLGKKLWVSAVIASALEDIGIKLIVVGGTAVAFYTLGGYATVDIDMIAPSTRELAEIMINLGFEKNGRFWERNDIDVFIEFPSDKLSGDYNRLKQIEINGLTTNLIGIEDLIIDRINAWWHWKSDEDKRWAKRLIEQYSQNFDFEYLKSIADKNGLYEPLSILIKG